jgi:hypothetical protein
LQCFNNIQIVEIFREKSVGGGNELENRPATQTLARFVAVNSMGKMPPLLEPLHLGAAFSFTRRQYDREEVERFANAGNRGDRRIGLALSCRRTVIPQAKTYPTAEGRARPRRSSRRPVIAVAKAPKPTSTA